MKKILIICPAYNEATKLPKLIDEFKKTDHFNNLFVINSGSTDDTESILPVKNLKKLFIENKNNILKIFFPLLLTYCVYLNYINTGKTLDKIFL